LKDINLSRLRNSIGYVSQEPILIIGSIIDNLRFANSTATDADIELALKRASAYDFVTNLEDGLNTYVGSPEYMDLSGGQKQRLVIARALIKNPKILILDEATSVLDPKSEGEVQEAILKISSDSELKLTIIIIAHRLQTIEAAANLLYIDSPKNIIGAEKGSEEYEVLMKRLETETYQY